jgi:RecJ-like exonuclease
MKRRFFFVAVSALLMVFCAREESRAPRYDAGACPFCTTQKGKCTYCNGTKKCSFCHGKGTRKVVVPDFPDKSIKTAGYEETCPFCEGKGVCRHCNGKGTCWACSGTGRIESWDFYGKAKE